ncbi:MAG: hypothetical protein WKF54_09135 [Nocardioidaceae bacterium]
MVLTINPDTPAPRCAFVTADQRLRVVNSTDRFNQAGKTITIRFPPFPPRVLEIGATTTFDRPFGAYLAPGVHDLRCSFPSGGGEIWLR